MPGGGAPSSPLASRSQAPPAASRSGKGRQAGRYYPEWRAARSPVACCDPTSDTIRLPPRTELPLLQSCLAPAASAFASLLRLLGFQPDAAGLHDDRVREEDVRGVALQRREDRALWRRGGRGADLLHLPPAGHQQLLRRGAEQAAPQAGADRQEQVCCH